MKKHYSFRNLIVTSSKLMFVLLLFTYGEMLYSQKTSCKATLEVENNISKKKATTAGTSYRLELTNVGFEKTTFVISLDENNINTRRSGESFKIQNEILDAEFKTRNKNYSEKGSLKSDDSNYRVTLKKDEKIKFYIYQTIPKGAKLGSKNTSTVIVTSEDCSNFKIETVLETELTDCCSQ